MINYLSGMVRAVEGLTVTLDIAGVGFELMSPQAAELQVGKQVVLYCYFNWSSEHGPSLFGFLHLSEKAVFELILKCPGIGPKIALSILSQMSSGAFVQALMTGSTGSLTALNGIGARKAEQLIVQLKGPAEKLIASGSLIFDAGAGSTQWKELADALQSLNYSRTEISSVLAATRAQASGTESFDQLLRKSLSILAKQRSGVSER
jgi:Holliday junction DNA helicase RuvA